MAIEQGRNISLATGALAAAVAVLALVNLNIASSPVDISPLPPASAPAAEDRAAGLDLATPLDGRTPAQFAEITGRPVFNPDRKPVRRQRVADAPDQRLDAGEMRLVGVMRIGDRPKRALIRLANEPTGKWVAEGDEINGWKLRSVNERGVVIESGGRTHELTLQVARRDNGDAGAGEPGRKPR